MSNKEHAASRFDEGFNCAQSVLSAFSRQFGMDDDAALKIACGFGGGLGRTGDVCGAVCGAVMVTGMKYGMTHAEDIKAKEKTYAHVELSRGTAGFAEP